MEGEVLRRLQSLHLHVKEDWLRAAVRYCETNNSQVDAEHVFPLVVELFLYSDLADSYIPEMIIPTAALKLCVVKPLIFQVIGCSNVSTPIYQQHLDKTRTRDNLNWFHGDNTDETADDDSDDHLKNIRLLKLKLSNGKQTVHAIEFGGELTLPDNGVIPGTKLLVTGKVVCRRGILLLSDSNCQFLGGEVASLFSSFEGLSKRAKSMGINTEKKSPSAKKLSSSLLKTKVSNGSTLSPFLVRMGDSGSSRIHNKDEDKVLTNPTQLKLEVYADVAPKVIHTGAPVGFVHPQPFRRFPKPAGASALPTKPVLPRVRVAANSRHVPEHSEAPPQMNRTLNPIIARLCGDPRRQDNSVSSQLKQIHRMSSQQSQHPEPLFREETCPTRTYNRRHTSVTDAFAALSREVNQEDATSETNRSMSDNVKQERIDIPLNTYNRVVPLVARKTVSSSNKRIPHGKPDPNQRTIASYFNAIMPRNPVTNIESKSSAENNRNAAAHEIKVVTLSQMNSSNDSEDLADEQCYTVDVLVPNGNQRRSSSNVMPSTSSNIQIGSRIYSNSVSREEPSESSTRNALTAAMMIPEDYSRFPMPCSREKVADSSATFPITSDIIKRNEDGPITRNPVRQLVPRTHLHNSEEHHDPVKKKRMSYTAESGLIIEELGMTHAKPRNVSEVTAPAQVHYELPQFEMATGQTVMDKFRQMDVQHLADVMKRKSFWLLPKMIHIQGIFKITSELKSYAGCWKLQAIMSDSSLQDVSCEFCPQLLERMLEFSVESCRSLAVGIDSVEITRRKNRANLMIKSLQRLDLLFKVEFSPDRQVVPVVFAVATLSEILQTP